MILGGKRLCTGAPKDDNFFVLLSWSWVFPTTAKKLVYVVEVFLKL